MVRTQVAWALALLLSVTLVSSGKAEETAQAVAVAVNNLRAQEVVEAHGKRELGRRRKGKRRRGRKKRKGKDGHDNGNADAHKQTCYNILDTWWKDREKKRDTHEAVVEMDSFCAHFSGHKDACKYKHARYTPEFADVPGQAKKASCVMIGAGSTTCVANACNQLNTGDCTLQDTAGTCVWYTDEQVAAINAYWTENNIDEKLRGSGCYRNRCNQPGSKRLGSAPCQAESIPGVFNCDYCQSRGDRRLKRKQMGCQMTVPQTSAECAPVNSKEYPKWSIYMDPKNRDCQCSDLYPICYLKVHGRDGNGGGHMVPRFRRGL